MYLNKKGFLRKPYNLRSRTATFIIYMDYEDIFSTTPDVAGQPSLSHTKSFRKSSNEDQLLPLLYLCVKYKLNSQDYDWSA